MTIFKLRRDFDFVFLKPVQEMLHPVFVFRVSAVLAVAALVTRKSSNKNANFQCR